MPRMTPPHRSTDRPTYHLLAAWPHVEAGGPIWRAFACSYVRILAAPADIGERNRPRIYHVRATYHLDAVAVPVPQSLAGRHSPRPDGSSGARTGAPRLARRRALVHGAGRAVRGSRDGYPRRPWFPRMAMGGPHAATDDTVAEPHDGALSGLTADATRPVVPIEELPGTRGAGDAGRVREGQGTDSGLDQRGHDGVRPMSKGGVRLQPEVARCVNVVVTRELRNRQQGESRRTGIALHADVRCLIGFENLSGDWRARLLVPCRATVYNYLRAAERLVARGVPLVVRPSTQDEWDRRRDRRLRRRRIVRARLRGETPPAERSTAPRSDV